MAEINYALQIPDPYYPTSSNNCPFLVNDPYSKAADKTGLQDGKLLSDNYDKIGKLKNIQKDLQTPGDPEVNITYFKNWASNQERVLLHFKPTKCCQIQNLVKKVINLPAEKQIKIGMGGSYHSWSPMYPDDGGLLINICDLKLKFPLDLKCGPPFIARDAENDEDTRIVLHLWDKDSGQKCVTISPGVTTGELMSFFLKNNVCFESDVILPTVTYGGVLSGGCHGTGRDQQSMSDKIVAMKLVNGEGDIVDLNEGVHLKAGQTSLGVLGVTVQYTIKVKNMSLCRVQNVFDKTLEDICGDKHNESDATNLGKLLNQFWSVELFWFPFNSIIESFLKIFEELTQSKPKITKISIPVDEDETRDLSQFFEVDDGGDDNENNNESNSTKGLQISSTNKRFHFNLLDFIFKIWKPGADKLWIRGVDLISGEQMTQHYSSLEPGVPSWAKAADVLALTGGNFMFQKAQQMSKYPPPLFFAAGFYGVKLQYEKMADEIVRTPWAVHYRDAIDLMQVYDMEFAFPIDIENPILALKAIQAVRNITKDYLNTSFPLSLCLEMRVIKKSCCLLCPATIGDKDHVAFIEVLSTLGTPGYDDFFKKVAKSWKELGGVPHWHKQLMIDDEDSLGMVDHIRKLYGKNIDKFNDVRKDIDPKGLFVNNLMERILKLDTSQ